MKVVHNKLVRDRIPDIIRADGKVAVTRVLDEVEFVRALKSKVREEADELMEAEGDSVVEEIADIFEVLGALCSAVGLDAATVERVRAAKTGERGCFNDRVFLVELHGGSAT